MLFSSCLLGPRHTCSVDSWKQSWTARKSSNIHKQTLMMTVYHKDAHYLCDPTDVLIYVTTAHIVHIASPRLQGRQGAMCYQLCHRGKGFKYLRSCRKNPAALGCAELDLVNCALPSGWGAGTQDASRQQPL